MSKWLFCLHCGQAYKSDNNLIQFCSKECIEDWKNGINLFRVNVVANYGEKDSSRYRVWRKAVLRKDKEKCRCCDNISNNNIHAHHIVSWSSNLELRYIVDNGICLCSQCHSIVHGFKIGSSKLIEDKEYVKKIRSIYIKEAKIGYMV